MKKLIAVCAMLCAFPASAQEALSPLQQYLYNESGYAPPQLAPAPQPEAIAAANPYAYPAYQQPQPEYAAPEVYYEEEQAPSDDGAALRNMLISVGN